VFSFGLSRAQLLSLGQTISALSSATHCLMKAIIHNKDNYRLLKYLRPSKAKVLAAKLLRLANAWEQLK
jgi:hypothetical protein